MILSRARRFIFVHIPKTGGTAFTLGYEERAAKDDILIGDTPKARRRAGRWKGAPAAGRLWKHSTLADVVGLVTAQEIDAFQVATLVRNPWDRMVSYYSWLRTQDFGHPDVERAKIHDFSTFLNHPQTTAAFRRWPYGAYLRQEDGSEKPGIFIRLENFQQDVIPVEAHLGFRLTMPVANQSDRRRDWRGYYSTLDAELVNDLCGEDIARFGYRFDPDP